MTALNWRRTALILAFDLRHSVFRLKGLIFLVPFLLFWFLVLRKFDSGVSAALQGDQAMVVASALFSHDVALNLLREHPPILSLFLVISLWSAPFFTLLAAHDQLASDTRSGYFRLLSTRCTRGELYLGRFLSQQAIVTGAHVLVGGACAVMSLVLAEFPPGHVGVYLAQILLTLFLYTAALAALFSITSAMASSALGALFLGMCGYWLAVILIWIGNAMFSESGMFSYLLPSGVRAHMFGVDAGYSLFAVSALAAYALLFGWLAFTIFRRRNF